MPHKLHNTKYNITVSADWIPFFTDNANSERKPQKYVPKTVVSDEYCVQSI